MTVELVLISSCVLCFAGAATRLMRRASAASRHAIWLAALLATVAIPAGRAWLPGVELLVLSPIVPEAAHAIAPVMILDSVPSDAGVQSTLPAIAARSTDEIGTWIWFAGMIAAGLWYLAGTIGVYRLRVGSTPGPLDLQARTIAHARAAGISRDVRVRISADDRVPMTWGLLRPTVLLPSSWRSWPAARLDTVLVHELAHAARLDVASHRIARIAAAVYWFNPLVWFALAQTQLERERACDDLVVSRGSLPSAYAADLLVFARALSAPAAVLPMARRSRLEGRVMAILDPRINRSGTSAIAAVFGTVLVVAAVIGSAIRISAFSLPAPPAQPARHAVMAERFQQTIPPPPPPAPERQLPPPPPPAPPRLVTPEAARKARCDYERSQIEKSGWDLANVYLACEPGIAVPTRARDVKPQYTPEAMRAKIQGTVVMTAIVDKDGVVRDARIAKSLDTVFGLDDQALNAVRAMEFMPGKLKGAPVRVLVELELQFTLR